MPDASTSPTGILALDHGPNRRWQLVVRVLTVSMVALFLLFVGIIVYWIARPDPFDPLTFQTVKVQEVMEDGIIIVPQVPGNDAPSVYVNQPVPTVFSFCSSADETFQAVGKSWFVDATHGTRYPLNEGLHSTIRPGCVSPRVAVDIPAQVRVDLSDFASGLPASPLGSPWYIEGELTPDVPGGVTARWQTETFLIVATRAPED